VDGELAVLAESHEEAEMHEKAEPHQEANAIWDEQAEENQKVEESQKDGPTEGEACREEDEERPELVADTGLDQSSPQKPLRQRVVDGCNVSVNMLGPFKLPTMNGMPKLPQAAQAKAKVEHLKKEVSGKVDEMGRRGREVLSDALDRGKDAWSASVSAVKDAQQAAVLQAAGLDCQRSATQQKSAETDSEAIFR